ncbi:MAG: sporulation integral membrane protein YtvI [Clostridiales bacterium]|nr:sporulation integral membrane protein YtvI [Clostridiales bacterium]
MTRQRKTDIMIDIGFVLLIIAVCGLALFALRYLLAYLLPFVIGFILTAAVQRPARWLRKKTRAPGGLWSVILVIFSYLAAVAVLILLVYQLYRQLSSFARTLPSYIPMISELFSGVNNHISAWFADLPEELSGAIQSMPGTAISKLADTLSVSLGNFAAAVAAALPGILVTSLVTIVASCFIAKDYDQIVGFIKEQLSGRYWRLLTDAKKLFGTNILKMLRGYLILMLLTFTELSIGLLLLRYNNAIALAAIIAIVDILPVLGTGTVLIPWVVIKLISGDLIGAVGLAVMYIVITIIRNILEPKIIGKQVGLHPLLTLLSMYAGLKILGVWGLFGFPIALIILKSLHDTGRLRLWKTGKFQGGTAAEGLAEQK